MSLNQAAVAQLVERVLGKDEVMGSSPISSFVALSAPSAVQVGFAWLSKQ